MSSLNLKGLARVALVAGLSLGLSACFRPLNGPTASGQSLQTELASIDVPEVEWPQGLENAGHYLRSELIYALNGSGSDTPKRYRLDLALRETKTSPVVDSEIGTASSVIVGGTLSYTLTSLDGKTVITRGTATAAASFDRFTQRFANIRAGRDAEIRLARDLAGQVKTRLAATLATRS
ncbi:LPS-assembly lipoprotein [Microvirga flocculans]|uniref:LPS-assembly lipoprotein n=1 Tax=Microvirga flocculans TaxID=217168 RepID=A0A7W6N6T5_9HYPH|nr:LPS assembly lipoprotein LptE [Microvirga flocculans]MBB4038927.1 LPS-assembly lipoprotein [Microvirga flocculans]